MTDAINSKVGGDPLPVSPEQEQEMGRLLDEMQTELPDLDRTKLEIAARQAFLDLGGSWSAGEVKDKARNLLKLRRDDPNDQAASRL